MKRTLTLAGITLIALPAAAYAQDRHHRSDRGHQMENLMATYDVNEDGQITQEEVDGFRADRLAAFDADGDGSLSLSEYEALWCKGRSSLMFRLLPFVLSFSRHVWMNSTPQNSVYG